MDLKIVVYGKNIEIIETLVRIINKYENWHALCYDNEGDLKLHFSEQESHVLLLSSKIGTKETEDLELWINNNYPSVKLIHHYGGGGGLLKAEIQCAILGIDSIKKPAHNCIL